MSATVEHGFQEKTTWVSKPGDIVEIKGEKRSTAAIYWRSRPEDTKMEIIRVDGIIRKNAGVSLGDRVTVSKVDAKECTKLVLSPVMANKQKVKFGPGIEGFARRGLSKRPVVQGDRIFIPGMTLFAEALALRSCQHSSKGHRQSHQRYGHRDQRRNG